MHVRPPVDFDSSLELSSPIDAEDDGDEFQDASDGSEADISEFTSRSLAQSSQSISDFPEDSQSMLKEVNVSPVVIDKVNEHSNSKDVSKANDGLKVLLYLQLVKLPVVMKL